MRSSCKRICEVIFCCRYPRPNPLKIMDLDTRLLPKNQRTRIFIEKRELHCFGIVGEPLLAHPIDIEHYPHGSIKKIVCGNNHCLVLFDNGLLAGFGGNEEGQLGFDIKQYGNYISELTVNPLEISNLANYIILDIAAGASYSLILIGANLKSSLIRLGVEVEDKYKETLPSLSTINQVHLEKEINGSITSIYAFDTRSILITKNNEIYVGGSDFQACPLENYKFVDRCEKHIKSLHLGSEFCLIFDVDGNLFGLGDGTYGELGVEKKSRLNNLEKIDLHLESPIAKISTGARHSMVLLENGSLYAFGDNSEGQCTGYASRYPSPHKVEYESRERIIDIYSGYTHNILVLENGNLYSWGDTSGGKLGYNESSFSQNTPKLIQVLKEKFPNVISLGFQMSVICTGPYETSLCNI